LPQTPFRELIAVSRSFSWIQREWRRKKYRKGTKKGEAGEEKEKSKKQEGREEKRCLSVDDE